MSRTGARADLTLLVFFSSPILFHDLGRYRANPSQPSCLLAEREPGSLLWAISSARN